MEKIIIRNPDELYLPDSEQIDWTKDPVFQFATEVDALQTLQALGEDLKNAREQVRQVMRYINAAAKSAHQGTNKDGPVSPQAIINHTRVARQTIYNMIGAQTAKDIRLTLNRSGEDDGWNWAEAATEQWIDAAEKAGLEVSVISIEVPDVNHDAAIVEVDGTQYRITVRNDEIAAFPTA